MRLLLALLSLFPSMSLAQQEHYVRAGASGANDGSDWTNAWTSLSQVTWVRGDTYYVAGGSYSGTTLDEPTSGETPIAILGATIASHGSAPDWSDSYAGQAVIDGTTTIASDYWTIDGQERGADWRSGYHLKFWNQGDPGGYAIGIHQTGFSASHWTLRNVEIMGTDTAGDQYSDAGFECYERCDDLTIADSWIHNVGSDNIAINFGGGSGHRHTYERDWISYNHRGRNPTHSQCIMETGSDVVWRYNVWQDCMSSAFIADANGAPLPNPYLSNWEIYGNVFFWDAEFAADGGSFIGDGIVGFFGETYSGYFRFVGNTIAGLSQTNTCNAGFYGLPPGKIVYDNVWWTPDDSCPIEALGGEGVDYNSYYGARANDADSGASSIVHSGQNPFVDVASFDFHLAGAGDVGCSSCGGLDLVGPYAIDLDGLARGADGAWDRGAYEVCTSADCAAPDAGPMTTRDGGSPLPGQDSGPAPDASTHGMPAGGCGCRTAPAGAPIAAGLVIAALLVVRRRARTR